MRRAWRISRSSRGQEPRSRAAAVYATRERAEQSEALLEALGTLDFSSQAPDEEAAASEEEPLSEEAKLALFKLQEELSATQEGIGPTLDLRIRSTNEAIKEIDDAVKANPAKEPEYAGRRAVLSDELSRLMTLQTVQKKRGLKEAKRLNATFVSDDGQMLPLDMECQLTESGSKVTAAVSDLTTPDSGDGSETRGTSREAILAATEEALEDGAVYGRGIVAIEVEGKIEQLRVGASLGQIASEGLENLTTVLTIAAIAAAPFTATATLTLLVPIGVVGAIPSGYRLIRKYEASTLRWTDASTLMDLVNIVGSAVSVGRLASSAGIARQVARAGEPAAWLVRTGKGLLIVGWALDGGGAVLLGGQLLVALDEASKLPEGEKRLKIAQILGGALVQAGIIAGGALADHVVQEQAQARLNALDEAKSRPGSLEKGPPPSPEKTTDVTEGGAGGESEQRLTTGEQTSGRADEQPLTVTEGKDGTPTVDSATEKGAVPTEGVPTTKRDESLSPTPDAALESLARGDRPEAKVEPLDIDLKTVSDDTVVERGVKNWDQAYARFNEVVTASNGREVGIWRDADGNYAIVVGSTRGVNPPEGGGWTAIVHYHPNPDATTRFRLPSPQDLSPLVKRFEETGQGGREFVEWGKPDGTRGRTEVGITPEEAKPYYVKVEEPDGTTKELRFASLEDFIKHWEGLEIFAGRSRADLVAEILAGGRAAPRRVGRERRTQGDGRHAAGQGYGERRGHTAGRRRQQQAAATKGRRKKDVDAASAPKEKKKKKTTTSKKKPPPPPGTAHARRPRPHR